MLKYDEPVLNVAINFNLRRYMMDGSICTAPTGFASLLELFEEVGRCKLTVSEPVFKVPMISALGTIL